MANLKSITDLPVAESAEGLNLIVNENGSAKQIAASAVGAQADFAVTDETSPAFIKNKPAVAQADWGVEDTTNPAFIKNRPFYDTREFETVTLTFDGDLTGKEFVQFEENYGAVKLSDKIPSKEELIGSTFSVYAEGNYWPNEIYEDMIYSPETGIIDVDGIFIVIYPEGINGDVPFTEGIWSYYGLEDDILQFYVTEISWNSVTSGELKTIEPRYVKDMYYSTQFNNVEILAETTQTPNEEGMIFLQEPMVGLVENGIYTVNWNGVKYNCHCYYDMGNYAYNLVSDAFRIRYANEMFNYEGYYAEIEIYDGSTSVTLSITGSYEEVEKINAKYMPNEIYDTINNMQNSINNVYNNVMSKNNPTGTGSFSMNTMRGVTIGQYSHAEGYGNTPSGGYSHAEGYATKATGERSHAEGDNTEASGMFSHTEGSNSVASGMLSHAEGNGTKAIGENSHAEGGYTTASGSNSHAEGYTTKASGKRSHAEGDNTEASGDYSHAEGSYTVAQRKNQHVQGEYNILDINGGTYTRGKYAHIVGNGTSDTARSNAHTLDWSGNAWYQGTVEGTGFILASPNGTRYKITVADDGTLSAVAV